MQLIKLQNTGIQLPSPIQGTNSRKIFNQEEQDKLINVKQSNKEYEHKLKLLQNRLKELEAQEKRNKLIEKLAVQKIDLLQAFQYRNKKKKEIKQEYKVQIQNDIYERRSKISKLKQKQKQNKEHKFFTLQSYKFAGSAEVRQQKEQIKQMLEVKRSQDMEMRQSVRDQILSNELAIKKQKIKEAQNKLNQSKLTMKNKINDEQAKLSEKQNLHNYQKSLEAQQKLGTIINKNRSENLNPRDSVDFSMSSTVTSQLTSRKKIDEGVRLLVPMSTRVKPAPKQLFKSTENMFY